MSKGVGTTKTAQGNASKPRLCIVSHFAFGALTGGDRGHIGGVEWQTSLMARWFAVHGYPTSMLTWDEGQDDEVVIDGIRVVKICRQDAGLPGVRFFHPRWTSLNRALHAADADVVYHNCAEYVTGQVALWCRRHHRGFVFSSASNMDCDPRLPELRSWRERILYRYGLRHAHRVIAQTRAQQASLRDGFRCPSDVIPMPCPGLLNGQFTQPAPPADKPRVLWVGRIMPLKRLEWLLDLAEGMPGATFDVAGPVEREDDYSAALVERAQRLPNIQLHGRVGRDQMPGLYRRAACLCCTSSVEGFPNTFLEAWSHGLPVVSTYDPDDLIATHGLGATAEDQRGLSHALRRLLGDVSTWRSASENARQYHLTNHTPDAVMPRFERVFRDVAEQVRSWQATTS